MFKNAYPVFTLDLEISLDLTVCILDLALLHPSTRFARIKLLT